MTCGIYCIENKINGKKYIGKGKDVFIRMTNPHETCRFINSAIKKYGKENFNRYIVEYCGLNELTEREQYYIQKWNTKTPNGYNLTDGGEGIVNPSPETRKKMRKAKLGTHHSAEWKENMCKRVSENGHPRFGTKLKNSSSSYFGVYKDGINKKYSYWRTIINVNGKNINLGNHKTEIEAAKKYDEYVIENKLNRPLNFQ
jgi:group I intron endonuclease